MCPDVVGTAATPDSIMLVQIHCPNDRVTAKCNLEGVACAGFRLSADTKRMCMGT